MNDFEYATGYEKNPIDLSYNKEKALRTWEERLKMVEQSGNFSNDPNGKAPFFSGKLWNDLSLKIDYCKQMISKVENDIDLH